MVSEIKLNLEMIKITNPQYEVTNLKVSMAKFLSLPVFLEKTRTLFFRYRRFSEKGSKKSKNSNFLTFFFKQVAETYFSLSTTPNTSFYQVSGVFMKYFSFYGPKTVQKWSFLAPKTPKINTRKS